MVRLRVSARATTVLAAVSGLLSLTTPAYAGILSSPTATGIVAPDTSSGQSQVTQPPVLQPPMTPALAHEGALRKRQFASDADMLRTCGVNFVRCDSVYCCRAGNTCKLQSGDWVCMVDGFGNGGFTMPDLSSLMKSASDLISNMYRSMATDPLYSSYFNSPQFSSLINAGNVNDITDVIDSITRTQTRGFGSRTSGLDFGPTNTNGFDNNNEDFDNDFSNGGSGGGKKKSGLSGGAIGGIVAGVILVLATIAGIFFFNRRSKRKNKTAVIPPHPIPGTQHAVYRPQPPPGGEGNHYAKPPIMENKVPGTPDTRPVSVAPVPQYSPPSFPAQEVEATPWAAGIAAQQAQQAQQQQQQQQSNIPYPTHAVETEARPWSQQPTPNLAPTAVGATSNPSLSPVSPNLSAIQAGGAGTGTLGSNAGTSVSAVTPPMPPQQVAAGGMPPPPPGPPPQQQQQYVPYSRPVYEMPGGEQRQ